MKQEVLIGQTDYTVLILIRDTAGAPKTGLTEASIDIAFARVETDNDVTTADVTPAALTALTDAHTDWGFEEVSATDHPGLYRLDLADSVFASGAWSAVVSVVGAGLDPTSIEFVLIAFNPRDGVRLGLTGLANAVPGEAGGLFIAGTNAATTVTTALTTTFTGNLTGSVNSVVGAVGSVIGAVGSVTGAVGSVTGAVGSVTGAVGSVTVVTDKTGYALSAGGVDAIWDDVIEGVWTMRKLVRGIVATLLAKLSGAATTTVVIRDIDDSKDRVTATVDASGNRTAVTLDLD